MHRSTTTALTLTLLLGAALLVPGAAGAKNGKNPAVGGERSDFALFDTTNANDPDLGVACGARTGSSKNPIPFTYFVAVSNFAATAAILDVTYADGDLVRYNIPAGGSFSLSQAAGSTAGVDDLITISSEGTSDLAGSMSVLVPAAAKPLAGFDSFCVTVKP